MFTLLLVLMDALGTSMCSALGHGGQLCEPTWLAVVLERHWWLPVFRGQHWCCNVSCGEEGIACHDVGATSYLREVDCLGLTLLLVVGPSE